MSRKGWRADKRIARTVAYLLRCPRSTVPEAMWACRFSDKESASPTTQMAVRRAREKAASGKRKAPPPNVIDARTVGMSTVSLLTTADAGSNSTTSPPSTPTTPGVEGDERGSK